MEDGQKKKWGESKVITPEQQFLGIMGNNFLRYETFRISLISNFMNPLKIANWFLETMKNKFEIKLVLKVL